MVQDLSEAAAARRADAARVSRDFAFVDDLVTLLGVAEYGLAVLFAGQCTIQLSVGADGQILSGGELVPRDRLSLEVGTGLAGEPSPDMVRRRPGILLVPQSATSACRAWVLFPTPRRIRVEEMIVADLFAQAFALAVDRVVSQDQAAKREVQLRLAIEGQRVIGQAAGILVERHRISPSAAFERLKVASQNRNIKLREIATRVVESGQEPDLA